MPNMGVTPMPPATRMLRGAASSSLKLLRGGSIGTVLPTRNCWCTYSEPPRLLRSRATPTT